MKNTCLSVAEAGADLDPTACDLVEDRVAAEIEAVA
jgi:hypothetical protein